MVERPTPVSQLHLLEEAQKLGKARIRENASVNEASKRTGELEKKISRLLTLEDPNKTSEEKGVGNVDENGIRRLGPEELEEITKRVARSLEEGHQPEIARFKVPMQEGDSVDVSLYAKRGLNINVAALDHILHIDNGWATIESEARKHKPLDPWTTPIGPRVNMHTDLGPEWSRRMNMVDFENYNSLLDRLSDPDVVRVDFSGSEK